MITGLACQRDQKVPAPTESRAGNSSRERDGVDLSGRLLKASGAIASSEATSSSAYVAPSLREIRLTAGRQTGADSATGARVRREAGRPPPCLETCPLAASSSDIQASAHLRGTSREASETSHAHDPHKQHGTALSPRLLHEADRRRPRLARADHPSLGPVLLPGILKQTCLFLRTPTRRLCDPGPMSSLTRRARMQTMGLVWTAALAAAPITMPVLLSLVSART